MSPAKGIGSSPWPRRDVGCRILGLQYEVDGSLLAASLRWRALWHLHRLARASHSPCCRYGLRSHSAEPDHLGEDERRHGESLPISARAPAAVQERRCPSHQQRDARQEGRSRSNVRTYPGASALGSDARRGLQDHPTVKPVAPLEDALLDVTSRGDLVIGPFLGIRLDPHRHREGWAGLLWRRTRHPLC